MINSDALVIEKKRVYILVSSSSLDKLSAKINALMSCNENNLILAGGIATMGPVFYQAVTITIPADEDYNSRLYL
jgi:hypothetical protein